MIKTYPFLEEFLVKYNEKFAVLSNPVVRQTMGRIATLKMASEIAGLDVNKLIEDIKGEIERQGRHTSGKSAKEERQERLKGIIKYIHSGVSFEEVKRRFNELISDLDASEIAEMEESLIREGMPVSEVQRLCDLHVNIFRDILDQKPVVEVSEEHPIYTYQMENRELRRLLQKIQDNLSKFKEDDIGKRGELRELLVKLQDINLHYLRKENQLFPYLERHGFTGPSQVMWGIHDEIRRQIKDVIHMVEEVDSEGISKQIPRLIVTMGEMIYKEENILFPTALKLLSDEEWSEIKKGESEIGFSFVKSGYKGETSDQRTNDKMREDIFNLSTGRLNVRQLDSLLKTLPLDISFVDENDEVRYYSDTKERIFPRSPGVIGRRVQLCHPPKSVHIVEKILQKFKSGEKDVAEFYIKMQGRDVHIRYFAVRGEEGRYLGTLEVSQDITEIKKMDQEKRLLDWEIV